MIALILVCSCLPALLFCWNLLLYREPPALTGERSPISVLVPARDEERSIRAAVTSLLASQEVEFELIVLDDASTDNTAGIVQAFAFHDARVRLEQAPALPAGWNGKQHACSVLAGLARYETLCFLDADVVVEPFALARMAAFMQSSQAALVSGFPRQITATWLEKLLLPLIHFVLLGYLPLIAMRRNRTAPSFAAGCGQFMMVRKQAYWASGGHAAIRATMHDGLLLPKLFRQHGYATDLADLTALATCRMYRSAGEVWRGLSKNATEGLAATARIVPFTVLLLFGQVLPFVLILATPAGSRHDWLLLCVCAAYLPRILAALRFEQSWASALLHPLGVAVLLALEWTAWAQKLTGRKPVWKQRAYDAG